MLASPLKDVYAKTDGVSQSAPSSKSLDQAGWPCAFLRIKDIRKHVRQRRLLSAHVMELESVCLSSQFDDVRSDPHTDLQRHL